MKEIAYSPEAKEDLLGNKYDVTSEFGEVVAKNVLANITKAIRNLAVYERMGTEISRRYEIPCDYLYFFTQKNYVFYRVDGDFIRIIRVLNEKRDFMQLLFGIPTITEDTEEY
jgi:plasmid stabilization system protein ParE